jgi:uncharacterized protein YjbI with pentapeptide repeats
MSDEPTTAPQRPTSADDKAGWQAYWTAQGMPWRTEPEIDTTRQEYLAERRDTITPDIAKGIYPFKQFEPKLTRADIEWLLATHVSRGVRGPVVWDEEKDKPGYARRVGLDLRGADLAKADLAGLPLACVRGGLTDSEWAAATEEQRTTAAAHLDGAYLREAHLDDANLAEAHLEGADLRFAYLERIDLTEAHLQHARLDGAHLEHATLTHAHLEGAWLFQAHLDEATLTKAYLAGTVLRAAHLVTADVRRAHLEGADLRLAQLERAFLNEAHLEGATLNEAHLEGAILTEAHLEGADLTGAHLEGKWLTSDELARIHTVIPDFPQTLYPARLRRAYLDTSTTLDNVTLGDGDLGFISLADVRWGGVNLAIVQWARIRGRPARKRLSWVTLGDERQAREPTDWEGKKKDAATSLAEFEAAARANRQLATVLRDQGLNDDADRFAYQAQVLQRTVLRRQGRYGAAFFSWVLDRLAGHGYKPGRTVLWYLAVIAAFTLTYFLLGPGEGHTFSPQGALVFSVTSFHGRGFFPGTLSLEDLVTQLAALEAVFGLFIEISFIATFTQRFFAR